MDLRGAVKCFLALVVGLPLIQITFAWMKGLLGAMGDELAAEMLGHLGTAIQVLWLLCLVGLVVLLAFNSLDNREE